MQIKPIKRKRNLFQNIVKKKIYYLMSSKILLESVLTVTTLIDLRGLHISISGH